MSEQRFDGSFRGHHVDMRNLIATLPGESSREIALIAPRDVARGSGATTSAAATAALLEIANSFSGSSHHKTLVFVSTDGSSIGALGVKRFIGDYSDADLLDAAIVLSQPALAPPTQPLVIPWSTGPQSTASQLAETANSTVSNELLTPAGNEGPLDDLFRLAIPAGLGEQGPLIEAGLPAVRLSADGELPVDPSRDTRESFDPDTFDRFGRSALSLILALDGSPGAVRHGPGTLHRGGRESAARLDDRHARAGAAAPGRPGRRLGTHVGGAQPDRGSSRLRLVPAADAAVHRRPDRHPHLVAGGPDAKPGLPVRPADRGPWCRRHDHRDPRGPLLLRDRVLPAPAAPATGAGRGHGRTCGPAGRLRRGPRHVAGQPVSGTAGVAGAPGVAAGGRPGLPAAGSPPRVSSWSGCCRWWCWSAISPGASTPDSGSGTTWS